MTDEELIELLTNLRDGRVTLDYAVNKVLAGPHDDIEPKGGPHA